MRMGGSTIEDEWDFTDPSSEDRTIVLFGKTGNGKSATGNSIIGESAFESMASFSGVTTSCKLRRTVLGDGQIVNVIDTPGLFDSAIESDFLSKEIVSCIKMARNGIHAVILVLHIGNRFTKEEETAVYSLQSLFGTKIVDYMIVAFTGGDKLDNVGTTLDDYLGRSCPPPLKEVLKLCKNRMVLFDNNTKDEAKRFEQVNRLMRLVNSLVEQNGGVPYTDELFIEMQKQATNLRDKQSELDSLSSKKAAASNEDLINLKEEINKSCDYQYKRITEMLEWKLRESTIRLERQLKDEQAARREAEKAALEAQWKANQQFSELRVKLEKSEKDADELRKQAKDQSEKLSKLAKKEAEERRKKAEELRKQAEKSSCTIL